MKLLTYNEWRAIGYQVKRGAHSYQRNAKGQPVYDREQVEEKEDFDRREQLRFDRD